MTDGPAIPIPPGTIAAVRGLDAHWIDVANRFGFTIERSEACWVAYDGAGTILVAPPETLDADDTLAQIILHELCHHFCEGPESSGSPDWGLDNTDERHVAHEHAALRLQAALADEHGLRRVLVATTDFRTYYEALSDEPLAAPDPDGSVGLARDGLRAARSHPQWAALDAALAATASRIDAEPA